MLITAHESAQGCIRLGSLSRQSNQLIAVGHTLFVSERLAWRQHTSGSHWLHSLGALALLLFASSTP